MTKKPLKQRLDNLAKKHYSLAKEIEKWGNENITDQVALEKLKANKGDAEKLSNLISDLSKKKDNSANVADDNNQEIDDLEEELKNSLNTMITSEIKFHHEPNLGLKSNEIVKAVKEQFRQLKKLDQFQLATAYTTGAFLNELSIRYNKRFRNICERKFVGKKYSTIMLYVNIFKLFRDYPLFQYCNKSVHFFNKNMKIIKKIAERNSEYWKLSFVEAMEKNLTVCFPEIKIEDE